MKKGSMYSKLNKHIQINIDCEGKHIKPIERYSLMEREKYKILTDKIEIVRVNLPYYVEKCYNEDINKLDYRDKFIGIIGIENKNLLKSLTEGDGNMEEIASKVEDFSSDEEILGAYDAEWHKIETERVVKLAIEEEKLANQKEYEEQKKELDELQKEVEEGKKEVEEGKKELEEQKHSYVKEALEQTAINMLKENIDINIISKVTGLNISQIKKLENK